MYLEAFELRFHVSFAGPGPVPDQLGALLPHRHPDTPKLPQRANLPAVAQTASTRMIQGLCLWGSGLKHPKP